LQEFEQLKPKSWAFSLEAAMDDNANYQQLVVNLVRHAIDLALQNDYYKRRTGEIGHFSEVPLTMKKLRELQPSVDTLGKAESDKEATAPLQEILAALARFHF